MRAGGGGVSVRSLSLAGMGWSSAPELVTAERGSAQLWRWRDAPQLLTGWDGGSGQFIFFFFSSVPFGRENCSGVRGKERCQACREPGEGSVCVCVFPHGFSVRGVAAFKPRRGGRWKVAPQAGLAAGGKLGQVSPLGCPGVQQPGSPRELNRFPKFPWDLRSLSRSGGGGEGAGAEPAGA